MAEILTIDEAAARLKLSADTVRDWCYKGKLKATKLGRVWRIEAAALDDLMRGKAPEASAETPQARKMAILARLQAMKAEGLSIQAIANRLNTDGVPTLSGKGRWQKGTVGNLLAEQEAP